MANEDETLTLSMTEGDYRISAGPAGLALRLLRSFDQRDERQYERCIVIPIADLPAVGDLVERFRQRGISLGLWS